jgi:hypothetical protein
VLAGWFDDGCEGTEWFRIVEDVSGTPVEHLSVPVDGRQAVVLVTTGGFDPVHHGHVAMLEAARSEVLRRGLHAAGGWVVCDHDEYVAGKRVDRLDGAARCALVDALSPAGCVADPYASCVADRSLKYTVLLARARRVIEKRRPELLGCEIWYVVGSDNASFASVFATAPAGFKLAVAARGGHECSPLPRYVIALGATPVVSSTAVRAGCCDGYC